MHLSLSIVITLGTGAWQQGPLWPGTPTVIHWVDREFDRWRKSRAPDAIPRVVECLRHLLEAMVQGGFLHSVTHQKRTLANVIHSLQSGLLVHVPRLT